MQGGQRSHKSSPMSWCVCNDAEDAETYRDTHMLTTCAQGQCDSKNGTTLVTETTTSTQRVPTLSSFFFLAGAFSAHKDAQQYTKKNILFERAKLPHLWSRFGNWCYTHTITTPQKSPTGASAPCLFVSSRKMTAFTGIPRESHLSAGEVTLGGMGSQTNRTKFSKSPKSRARAASFKGTHVSLPQYIKTQHK